jgi:integrase
LFKVKKGFEIYAPKKDKLPADHKGLKQALYINRTGRFDKKERALTQEELDAIEHYPLPHIKLERIRAIFMVLAYTGMDQKVARTLRLHKGQIFLDKKPYQGPGADRIAPFLQTIGEWPVWFTPFSVRMRAMFRAALPPKGITYITVGGQPRVLDRYKILSMETGKNTFRALNLPPKKKKSKTGLSQREAMKLMWDKYRAMTPEQRAAQVPKVSYSRKGSRKGKQYKGRGGLLRGLGLSELYFKNTQNQDTTQNQNNP